MVVKVGRYISPLDIEAQLAPDNYLFSHSITFTCDPYTFTNVESMIGQNQYWSAVLGVHGGNDMALWSNSAQPNGQVLVRWVSTDNNDSLWTAVNSIGSGKFTNEHDNLQQVVETWGHRFKKTFHMMTEAYYMWMFDARLGGTCIDGPSHDFAPGGGCGAPITDSSGNPRRADVLGAVNSFQVLLGPDDYLSLPNDFFWDPQGERTGIVIPNVGLATGHGGVYSSHTLGWVHFFSPYFYMRPEIRYERTYTAGLRVLGLGPYDNGIRMDQVKGAMDVILRF